MLKKKYFDDDEENLYTGELLDDEDLDDDSEETEYSVTEDATPKKHKELTEKERLAFYGLSEKKNGHYADNAKMYECICAYKQEIYKWLPFHNEWQIKQEAANLHEGKPRTCERKFLEAHREEITSIAEHLDDKAVEEIRNLKEPERPDIPRYLAECFIKIPTHLCYRPNFSGYTYKDEFIADAIEAEIKYAANFDETKFKNPFAYFTQICWQSFVRRIQVEKQQSIIKGHYLKNFEMDEEFLIDEDLDKYLQNDGFKNNHVYVKMAIDEENKRNKLKEEKRLEREQRLYDKNHSSALEEFLVE